MKDIKNIIKNVIKAKIANLNLSMKPIDISTGFVLDILTKDDPQSIQMRKNFNRKKLTAESLLDLISAATLFSRVPAALKTAPIIAKIYKPGFKKIFTVFFSPVFVLINFTAPAYTPAMSAHPALIKS